MAGIFNIEVEQGATYQKPITWRDGAGSLVNLTGFTAQLLVRKLQNNALVLDLTSGSGITLGGAAGTITVTIDAATTTSLPLAEAVYDLFLTSGSGYVKRLLTGDFNTIGTTVE